MMKRMMVATGIAAAALEGAAAALPTYSLGNPHVTVVCNVTNRADYVRLDLDTWALSNACYAGVSAACFRGSNMGDDEIAWSPRRDRGAQLPVRTVDSALAGFPAERNKPQYYLGDTLAPPDDVDWDATYQLFLSRPALAERFLFDTVNQYVYIIGGGTAVFPWVVRGAADPVEVPVVASPVGSGRPKNIFWTDAEYGGKMIDLTGKHVGLYGPSNLLTVVTALQETGEYIGGATSSYEVVQSGVYVSVTDSAKSLYAAGRLEGQFVLVYYDSALKERIVDVQVVEVTRPRTEIMRGVIGTELKPSGRGYGITGLTASPTTLDEPDNYGPYLYQHTGANNYSPKHKSVFPLRPTDDKTRNQTQIYWMETDNQGISWPFEIDEYLVSWPEDIPVFVRSGDPEAPGAPIVIPGDYTAELQKYQEGPDGNPAFHATAPQDGVFSTYAAGRSLLKLSGSDNVWFLPVQSVLRTDRSWFTLEPASAKVGEILSMRGGSMSGLAEGRAIATDRRVPGYLHEPGSDPIWNTAFYSADGTGWKGCPSEVCPVTASLDPSVTNKVEVWWSSAFQEEDMPKRITIPALPQVYSVFWPEADEAPQIAVASQMGSAGRSVCCADHALVFDAAEASLAIPDVRLFGRTDGCGAVMLWTRPFDDAATLAPSRLLTLGSADRTSARVSLSVAKDGDGMKAVATVGDVTLEKALADPRGWTHLALSWSPSSTVLSAVTADGRAEAVTGAAPDADTRAALSEALYGNAVGWTAHDAASATARRIVDGICCWNRPLDLADPSTAVETAFLKLDGQADGQTFCVPFTGEDELENILNGETRTAYDLVSGRALTARNCLRANPGAPAANDGTVIASDVAPVVYRQADPEATGYNPNEEHAFVEAGRGGYVAWAVRCDLNDISGRTPVSRPATLVQYVRDGRARMACFSVVPTNRYYATFGGACEAGKALPGPQPLTLFPDPWLREDYWQNDRYGDEATMPYRDRKGQLWARAKGRFDIYMHYAQRDDFDWPAELAKPAIGAAVPWLAYLDDPEDSNRGKANGEKPHKWAWNVSWPKTTAVMKIGQTLTDPVNGLPEMWNAASMAVVYPTAADGVGDPEDTVLLTDPTCAQVAKLGCRVSDLAAIGLKAGPGGKLIESKGLYYFREVSPSLANCLYLDPSNDTLVMRGCREDNPGGVELLFLNVLTAANRDDVLALVKDFEGAPEHKALSDALDALVACGTKKPTVTNKESTNGEIVSTYAARDHYALTAMGATNYVVVIENDATNDWCDAGNPVNMHIFRVADDYYTGRVLTREDPLNLLSQVLDVFSTETFAGQAGDYVFDWRYARPDERGRTPDDPEQYVSKFSPEEGVGRTSFTVGGQGDTLDNMVNTYWTCRYRAREGTAAYGTMGARWSDWYRPPALAEGWVQRVLNNVTPFNQRMTDLYNNPVETAVSMIQQAGGPYTGDVALNQDNLTSVGLIELYRTILNKAESMSLKLGVSDTGANQQLLLATERLHDLYCILGDEAYADAANPTIGFGTENAPETLTHDYSTASSALFCFDNQVPTLLDEELCLLRGRSCVDAPDNTVGPYYNRLVWNFTKGITAGEVAYAVNYDISDSKTATIDASSAAKLHPQGHGDAYGHYLSALQGWYRLLRNPNFNWGDPAIGALNVADNAVNADYCEEAKFAAVAAAAARTARRTVELTALKHWRDRGADTVGGGYLDTDGNTAFGYGEWASRGAFGALCNWAVANSLLPDAENGEANVDYTDKGLLKIDRGTVAEIGEIASAAEAIQRTEDLMDAGRNPLGMDENAIPFDLTPIGSAEDATHYEQVRERAATAFANARAILDRAQEYSYNLRYLEEARAAEVDRIDEFESDFTAQLVELYGRPYADDVGAGKTYPEGYDGPDLYHYMWVNNLSDYGLARVEDSAVVTTVTYRVIGYDAFGAISKVSADTVLTGAEQGVLSYSLAANGVVVKDRGISGSRPACGELQQAYADFLCAYGAVLDARDAYSRKQDGLKRTIGAASAKLTSLVEYAGKVENSFDEIERLNEVLMAVQITSLVFDGLYNAADLGLSSQGVGDEGLLFSPKSEIAALLAKIALIGGEVANAGRMASDISAAVFERQIADAEVEIERSGLKYEAEMTKVDIWNDLRAAEEETLDAAYALRDAWRTMNAAQVQVSALVQKGVDLLEARELARSQAVNGLTKMRYNDMFLRQMRNDALGRYDTAFDLARRYAFLAAKAYGYETGSMPDDLIRQIVAARALGETDGEGNPIVSGRGDTGLAGALAKMDANWGNLRTQLGFNNPQGYATWFSLRHELFRILRGELGDEAWKTELAKHWVEDIRTNPDFLRHCQPFASRFALAEKEPGLIITFETTVDFALNLFGKPLAYDDSQFDSSWFATKISSAGVWFENYNEGTEDYTGRETAFAATPNVYLVPVGTDRMRVPGSDGEEIAEFSVLDQTVPVPYPVTPAEIAEANWLPSYLKGEYAGVDKETRIRRHPSFRAYYGPEDEDPSDDQLDAVRLTGRSVWNTKWMLVIPAGTLNSNREKALKAFIGGLDVNGDGLIDLKGVSDIKIGFKTYSYGGK